MCRDGSGKPVTCSGGPSGSKPVGSGSGSLPDYGNYYSDYGAWNSMNGSFNHQAYYRNFAYSGNPYVGAWRNAPDAMYVMHAALNGAPNAIAATSYGYWREDATTTSSYEIVDGQRVPTIHGKRSVWVQTQGNDNPLYAAWKSYWGNLYLTAEVFNMAPDFSKPIWHRDLARAIVPDNITIDINGLGVLIYGKA